MNRTQLMLAIYAFLASGLIFYGYVRRNRYPDVLLASIGVAIVGVALALSAFGVALAFARLLFQLGTVLAVAVAVLLGMRVFSAAFRGVRKGIEEKPPEPRRPDDRKAREKKSDDDIDKAA